MQQSPINATKPHQCGLYRRGVGAPDDDDQTTCAAPRHCGPGNRPAVLPSAVTRASQPPPVFVEEPSSPELGRDKAKLDVLSNRRDLSAVQSAADNLAQKWRVLDRISYYCLLSAVCDDLMARDSDPSDLSRRQSVAEKYVAEALDDGAPMPLTMRAFFVGRLTYAPGHGRAGVRGKEWSRLRSRRLAPWLGTW